MKIAVTCENDSVFQHFGHTPGFAIFETDDQTILSSSYLSAGESGHGALAACLAAAEVNVLICGGIGAGAINALAQAEIKVIGGASGNVREAVQAYLNGSLKVRPNFHCNHHHHAPGHTCSDHGCGSGKCGH